MTLAAEARRRALGVLLHIERGLPLPPRLEAAAAGLEDERDRALLHQLVLGTLRRRGWLDLALGRLSSRPLERVDPRTLEVLRLGAYQLLYLRTPRHAAVSESVALARERGPRAAGFVNAILRRLAREGPPPEPDASSDALAWLRSAGSLPEWLAQRWLERLGPDRAIARARAALDAPPTFLRLNPGQPAAREVVESEGVTLSPGVVPGAASATGAALGPLAERALLYVQDQGSQLVARLAAGEGLLLDACAAPGGKAVLLADLAQQDATRVLAADVSRARLGVLARLARHWGATRLFPVAADALAPPFRRPFDSVLLDAPCSGLGTLARNPDIRWRLSPQDLERHAVRQQALLESVCRLVRPGGRLVYAVCSLEPEETDAVVDPFLARHPEFRADPLPEWARPFARGDRVELDPAVHRGDGFFAVRLVRR